MPILIDLEMQPSRKQNNHECVKGMRAAEQSPDEPASRQNLREAQSYKGGSLSKKPSEMGIYPLLLWRLKPRTILEIGSNGGGSALWIGDLCDAYGLDCRIHSLGIARPRNVKHRRVTFYEADTRNLGAAWTESLLAFLPHPWLVIQGAGDSQETSLAMLTFFDAHLTRDDVVVIEDAIAADLPQIREGGSSRDLALRQFLRKNFVEWESIGDYGDDAGSKDTRTSNVFLRKTGLKKLSKEVCPQRPDLVDLVKKKEFHAALEKLDLLKGSQGAVRGTDYLRAFCFWKLGRPYDALEAAKEEARWFPDHVQAAKLADYLSAKLFPPPKLGNDEFKTLYRIVRPYTMLSEERLHSLYELARRACVFDVPGDFVECGVAAGGSSALLAAVIASHSKRPRRLYACDTFSGMPAPTEKDTHEGVRAEMSGWGLGTCAAPTDSLLEVCGKLGVQRLVTPVPGLFAETLPKLREQVGAIAFLHMDGDWYESTRDILENLYECVQPGAAIQVDDYGYWRGCRDAVHEFEQERGLSFVIHEVDSTGVWFCKPRADGQALHLLNLGCGRRFHHSWLNLDIAPADPAVIAHDLSKPLPLDDATCSAVYHSHVLEHLPKDKAGEFIAECYRVLAPGGVLRVAVPDLETIARLYLENLEASSRGDEVAARRHEWMTIELVDQLARHRGGGEMLKYWKQNPMPAEEFVLERMGAEARDFVTAFRASATAPPAAREEEEPSAVGKFRLSGEVHQWMYDRVSLSRLLSGAGFTDICVCTATESAIPGFAEYELDTDATGRVRKPDSLFMEARKPR